MKQQIIQQDEQQNAQSDTQNGSHTGSQQTAQLYMEQNNVSNPQPFTQQKEQQTTQQSAQKSPGTKDSVTPQKPRHKIKIIRQVAYMLFSFIIIAIAASAIMAFLEESKHHKEACKDEIMSVGDYLLSIIMEDPEGFLAYKDYYEDHYKELRIPVDFDECTTARDEFYRRFQEAYPGENFIPAAMPEDMSEELKNLYYTYRQEYWILTFEQSREAFDLPYTYFLLPDDETHYTMYMIDGERTEDKEHPGYLYMGDSYYEEPADHELLWKTWNTARRYNEVYEWNNEWGNTYSCYTPLVINDECIGLVVTEIDVSEVESLIKNSTLTLVIRLAIILITCTAILLFFINRNHIKRIVHLTSQIDEFSTNRAYDTVDAIRSYTYGADEITTLADNTANMISELQIHEEKVARAAQFKSDFLANMSHEIRTPMNAIVGLSELLLKEEMNSKGKKYAHQINSSANALLVIINDILDFSRIEEGNMDIVPSNYNVRHLVDDVVNLTSMGLQEKPVTMKLNISPETPKYLYGDSSRIKQVLGNVLSNAVKFTKEGYITVAVDSEKKDDHNIILSIIVSDTGIGIKKQDYEKIFESFSQVDSTRSRDVEGTGLGLAISQRLIHLMNGTIEVESEYGEGSVFTLKIPQTIVMQPAGSESVPISDQEASGKKLEARKANVLVVDDNSVNLFVAKSLLETFDIRPTCVKSGEQAIKAALGHHYDLILMDYMMPQMDGIEAAQKIREACPNYECIPIIAFTANAVGEAKEKLLNEGMDDFISKPVKANELEALLKKWLPVDTME